MELLCELDHGTSRKRLFYPTRIGAAVTAGHFGDGFAQVFEEKRFADNAIHAGKGVAGGLEHLGVGGNHDYGLFGRTCFDGGGQFVAFHVGHREVSNHDVEPAFIIKSQGLLAVVRGFDDVAVEVEHHLDGIADEGFVVHYQNVSFWKGWHRYVQLQ